jgi:hypothetical protein
MITYDIPFSSIPTGQWGVCFSSGKIQLFNTRVAALAFAMRDAERKRREGLAAVVSVEGADGRWRAFDPDMKPPGVAA